jgi:hypothetical protein
VPIPFLNKGIEGFTIPQLSVFKTSFQVRSHEKIKKLLYWRAGLLKEILAGIESGAFEKADDKDFESMKKVVNCLK